MVASGPVKILFIIDNFSSPFAGTEGQLFKLLKRPYEPFWVDGAGHNNIEALLRDNGAFFNRINEFLEEWCRPQLAGVSSGGGDSGGVDALVDSRV